MDREGQVCYLLRPQEVFPGTSRLYIDSRTLDDGVIIDSEVCIIGAGAAGITLARELAGQLFRVVMIESGGFDYDDETNRLLRVVNRGREYWNLPRSRLRYFGGTTNHWGGHCGPMAPLNFERRPWIPDSGWPISRHDLDPYYLRAHEVIGLGPFDYDPKRTAAALGMNLFPFDSSRVQTVVSRYNSLRFGPHYRHELDRAENLTTYLWGNVANINRHPSNAYVKDVTVRTLSGKNFTVRARHFVLALGGIENARLLLLSRDIEAAGLGNGYDLVGRYFMEHILYWSGMILRAGLEPLFKFYGGEHSLDNIAVRGHIALPDKLLRDLRIPFYRAELEVLRPSFFNTDAGRSARRLRRHAIRRTWPKDLIRHLTNMLLGLDDVVNYYIGETENFPALYVLENYVEQIPNPESRIGLARRRDALGLIRATLKWRLSNLDKIGIRKAQQVIAAEVGRSGFGRMRIEMPEHEDVVLEGARGGSHHMGTTRMHDHARYGVVDANCRVHGLNNLFVTGSSVFPTGGYINPTLTIVALTIRLGDHLKTRMKT